MENENEDVFDDAEDDLSEGEYGSLSWWLS